VPPSPPWAPGGLVHSCVSSVYQGTWNYFPRCCSHASGPIVLGTGCPWYLLHT
jgi:hypothetical protein